MTDTVKIYVDIESLFDIRQGILYSLVENKEKLAEFISSEEYNFRDIDNFSIVNNSEYQKAYNKKDLSVLPNSTISYILTCIKSKLDNLEKRNTFYNEKKIPEVVVNTYPFVFNEKQKEQFQNLLFVKLETNTMVNVIYIPTKELTPMFFSNNNFIVAFIYDFTEWMNTNSKTLEAVKKQDLMLYFPSLSKELISAEELKKITSLGFKDIFSYTEFLLSSVISINFLPVIFYSNLMIAVAHLSKFDDLYKKKEMKLDEDVDISKFNIPEGV